MHWLFNGAQRTMLGGLARNVVKRRAKVVEDLFEREPQFVRGRSFEERFLVRITVVANATAQLPRSTYQCRRHVESVVHAHARKSG